ncbi:MAG: RNA-binding protein [Bacteroidales bacterium]|nr:RNA-binding protein [Bacteroidales bacterium]
MKIFIAKLAPKTTSDDVKKLFEKYGKVSVCKVIMDHETKRSKCYGFVEMPVETEAYVAVVETDNMEFMGSVLDVKKSKPQPVQTKK